MAFLNLGKKEKDFTDLTESNIEVLKDNEPKKFPKENDRTEVLKKIKQYYNDLVKSDIEKIFEENKIDQKYKEVYYKKYGDKRVSKYLDSHIDEHVDEREHDVDEYLKNAEKNDNIEYLFVAKYYNDKIIFDTILKKMILFHIPQINFFNFRYDPGYVIINKNLSKHNFKEIIDKIENPISGQLVEHDTGYQKVYPDYRYFDESHLNYFDKLNLKNFDDQIDFESKFNKDYQNPYFTSALLLYSSKLFFDSYIDSIIRDKEDRLKTILNFNKLIFIFLAKLPDFNENDRKILNDIFKEQVLSEFNLDMDNFRKSLGSKENVIFLNQHNTNFIITTNQNVFEIDFMKDDIIRDMGEKDNFFNKLFEFEAIMAQISKFTKEQNDNKLLFKSNNMKGIGISEYNKIKNFNVNQTANYITFLTDVNHMIKNTSKFFESLDLGKIKTNLKLKGFFERGFFGFIRNLPNEIRKILDYLVYILDKLSKLLLFGLGSLSFWVVLSVKNYIGTWKIISGDTQVTITRELSTVISENLTEFTIYLSILTFSIHLASLIYIGYSGVNKIESFEYYINWSFVISFSILIFSYFTFVYAFLICILLIAIVLMVRKYHIEVIEKSV